jgi:hypothetical protein
MAIVTVYRAAITAGPSVGGVVFSFDPIDGVVYGGPAVPELGCHPVRVGVGEPIRLVVPDGVVVEVLPDGRKGVRDPLIRDRYLGALEFVGLVSGE